MLKGTFVEISPEEQAQMLAALRRARYGYLLALHILLLCAAGRTPTGIAAVLFCSRSSLYRTVRAYQEGTLGLEHDDQGRLVPPVRTTMLLPTLRRSVVALLKAPPGASGWCRTRWSCATLVLTLQANWGLMVSAETISRWVELLPGDLALLAAPTQPVPPRVRRLRAARFQLPVVAPDAIVLVVASELLAPLHPQV